MAADFGDPAWALFSAQQNDAGRPQFGTRYLTDEAAVYTQNAWDHVPPPTDQADAVAAALARQQRAPVAGPDADKYNAKPSSYWNSFYKNNEDNFFRDRKWLMREFPALMRCCLPDAGPRTIVEIGCGAGNSVFPLLAENKNPALALHALDYSAHAVKLVQRHALYAAPPCGTVHAAVWDLAGPDPPPGIAEGSVDVAVLVFVLSALHPDEWVRALAHVRRLLKPGGLACVRDYGRHDLTQLRFKAGRLLADNFYVRGDHTRVYFFALDELALMWTGKRAAAGEATSSMTEEVDEGTAAAPDTDAAAVSAEAEAAAGQVLEAQAAVSSAAPRDCDDEAAAGQAAVGTPARHWPADDAAAAPDPDAIHPHLRALEAARAPPAFALEQLHVDRRLLVNRKRQLKMYRVWMQGQFRKL